MSPSADLIGASKSISMVAEVGGWELLIVESLASPEIGCTLGMKIKKAFYFAFYSVCTIFVTENS